MQLPSLVTSVPDLHTARILAAAGVKYIAFSSGTQNLGDIIQWLEGPQVGLEILEAESRISAVDFLIVPYELHDQYAFSDKRIFWKTDQSAIYREDGMIYLKGAMSGTSPDKTGLRFYHYADCMGKAVEWSWMDRDEDTGWYEKLFVGD